MGLSSTAAGDASLRQARCDLVGFRESASVGSEGRGGYHLEFVHHCQKVDQPHTEPQRPSSGTKNPLWRPRVGLAAKEGLRGSQLPVEICDLAVPPFSTPLSHNLLNSC